jgi:hypothetical protein
MAALQHHDGSRAFPQGKEPAMMRHSGDILVVALTAEALRVRAHHSNTECLPSGVSIRGVDGPALASVPGAQPFAMSTGEKPICTLISACHCSYPPIPSCGSTMRFSASLPARKYPPCLVLNAPLSVVYDAQVSLTRHRTAAYIPLCQL